MSSNVAIWLRIPKLLFELYHAQFLWRIGSTLGNMLKVDRLTSIHSCGKFARICFEMDLAKPLTSHIAIRGHNLVIEYEDLHQTCFRCSRYGHKADKCQEILEQEEPAVKVGESPNNPTKVDEHSQGKPVESSEMAKDPKETMTTEGLGTAVNGRADVEKKVVEDQPNRSGAKSSEIKDEAEFGPWNITQRNFTPKNPKNQQPNVVRDNLKGNSHKKGKEVSKAVTNGDVKGYLVANHGKGPTSQGSRFFILNAVKEDDANQKDSVKEGVDFAFNTNQAQAIKVQRVRNASGRKNP